MDRTELHRALRQAAVPPGHYWIESVHEPSPTPVDFLWLRGGPDGSWETGVYERGASHLIARHSSEAAACAHLRELLA
ncbi:hypothetical protein ABT391_08825 [Streptomyces jumonjinensis]|uniref:S10 family peptidase n=1 Tax=Streptomyces jumonjinensis TaxID=1945 RepID=A0A646KIQ5_STRJU|nr:hypothetical protein [Streptomyces jumonjinensis]MQT02093.1 S10 family peptidase [Streptomyces jumonjinensis]